MQLQKGQIVHVRAEVVSTTPDRGGDFTVRLKYSGGRCNFNVSPSEIVHAEPLPLAVGDKVAWGNMVERFEILAIDGGWAWLKAPGIRTTELLSNLERVP